MFRSNKIFFSYSTFHIPTKKRVREDLEKEISDVDKRDRREPIELMTPIIPEPTPAPAPEIVEELP